jgi:hypothetical protein
MSAFLPCRAAGAAKVWGVNAARECSERSTVYGRTGALTASELGHDGDGHHARHTCSASGSSDFMVSVTSDPTWVARWRALSAANAAVSKKVRSKGPCLMLMDRIFSPHSRRTRGSDRTTYPTLTHWSRIGAYYRLFW